MEACEGVVRVSVVATGIDEPRCGAPAATGGKRTHGTVAGKLHHDGRRIADRIERGEPWQSNSWARRCARRPPTLKDDRQSRFRNMRAKRFRKAPINSGRSSPMYNSIQEDVLDVPATAPPPKAF